ncbi:GntR family transcriptional regulator [Actinoplanes lutulentus]|uniref:GntR family transcriptional regulator n=1 Tax=Actinoplanes lutulentus TaxID=1287878 RepID=A0A327Z606_9ACTN|nr:GntR family transcriptional regulator [Actinoplanes lutulentus]MBB2945114.1 GntR family transcriptional regulator [Actinoplanes lutulentus]RAK31910.1 GntR family transcriptional regulator [Actinoplanes lutulentus]
MADRVPAYQRIAADLAEKIRGGVYRPGDALPAQRELSASYGVTLMTLRQALQQLTNEGLIVQQAGRGTFVTPAQAAYRVDTLRSFVEDLREQGHEVTTVVLNNAGGVLERLRILDGRPAIHQTSKIAAPVDVKREDFRYISLYEALDKAGVTIARASERIVPGLLPAESAVHLERETGSPIFVSERTTFGINEEILVEDRAIILGDLLEIRAERAATRLSLQWGSSVDLGQ